MYGSAIINSSIYQEIDDISQTVKPWFVVWTYKLAEGELFA